MNLNDTINRNAICISLLDDTKSCSKIRTLASNLAQLEKSSFLKSYDIIDNL